MPPMHLGKPGAATPTEVALEKEPGSAHQFMARLGSANVPVDIDHLPDGRGILRRGGKIHPFYYTRRKDGIELWIDGKRHLVEVSDPHARRAASGAVAPAGDIIAAMPGTILKIEIAPGDSFAAHQPLVIMESMKMEMTLSSPQPGRAREIRCRVGQLVDMGAVLVAVEQTSTIDSAKPE